MEIKNKIIEEIRKIYDPELPVNIYELGLIYDIKVEGRKAEIKMTLTTPNCPVAESLPKEVKEGSMQVEEIDDVDLQLVWDPPWNKDMMSDAAKLELNFVMNPIIKLSENAEQIKEIMSVPKKML